MKIYMRDVRSCFLCSAGTREFFNKHGLDFSDFLKNGITEEQLIKTNDLQAKKVVDYVRKANGQ